MPISLKAAANLVVAAGAVAKAADPAKAQEGGGGESPQARAGTAGTKTLASRVCSGDTPGDVVVRAPTGALVRLERRALATAEIADELVARAHKSYASCPRAGSRCGFLSLRIPRATRRQFARGAARDAAGERGAGGGKPPPSADAVARDAARDVGRPARFKDLPMRRGVVEEAEPWVVYYVAVAEGKLRVHELRTAQSACVTRARAVCTLRI